MKELARLIMILSVFFVLVGCSNSSWDFTSPPVEGDEPAIRITDVVWYKNFFEGENIRVKGQVYNVADPKKYKVSIWIKVGSWWPKPTFDKPFTGISSNGRWSNEVVTGGHDEDADAIKVYMVKKGSAWVPGKNDAPPGDIVAEDIVYKSS